MTINRGGGTAQTFEILPEGSSYNAVMTYDKAKNLKYWTTDVTLAVGGMFDAIVDFLDDAKACPIEIVLTMNYKNEGATADVTVTVSDAYIANGTFNSGANKTDGHTGTVAFQAITLNGPTVSA